MRGGARKLGWRAAACLAAALVVLGLAERGARVVVSRRLLATAGAQWIWAPGALKRSEPLAFYAVRDFELDALPAQARVYVLADEAYLLYINGTRVGSGAYFAGAPLDNYRVEGLLRPGWNRVAIELRSGRGAGGLLCSMFGEGSRAPLLLTGGDWRIFRDSLGVVEGLRNIAEGEPALVWQSPPTGGWGVPRVAPERPRYRDSIATAPGHLDPTLLEPRTEPLPTTETGAPLINDFGRVVSGYLILSGLGGAPRRLRIEVGLERQGGEWVDVLMADGESSWSSAEARTLRYVGSPYLPEGATLGVVEVKADLAARDAERAAKRKLGVFGVEPPPQELRREPAG